MNEHIHDVLDLFRSQYSNDFIASGAGAIEAHKNITTAFMYFNAQQARLRSAMQDGCKPLSRQ